jgi:hypothetical protein
LYDFFVKWIRHICNILSPRRLYFQNCTTDRKKEKPETSFRSEARIGRPDLCLIQFLMRGNKMIRL